MRCLPISRIRRWAASTSPATTTRNSSTGTKPGPDNATPSGNGVAACALIAFGHLAAAPRYVDAAERCVRLFAPTLAESPGGCSTLLNALAALEAPPTAVLIDGAADEARKWQRELEKAYRPSVRVFNVAGVSPLPPALAKGARPASGVVAWVCQGTRCLPPITTLAKVGQELDIDAAPTAALQDPRNADVP